MAYDIPCKLLGLVRPTVCTCNAPAVFVVLPVVCCMSWQGAASDATSGDFERRLSMTLDALRDLQAQLLFSCAAGSYVYTGVYILCCPPPSVTLRVHNLSTDTVSQKRAEEASLFQPRTRC